MEAKTAQAAIPGDAIVLSAPDPALRLAGVPGPSAGADRGSRPSRRRTARRALTLALGLAASAAVALIVALPGTAAGQPVVQRLATAQAKQSVLPLSGVTCGMAVSGTAWVAEPGLLVTAAHVVAGMDSPSVAPPGGAGLTATPVHFDPVNDIALLRVRGLDAPALELSSQPEPGTAARSIGYPDGAFEVGRGRLEATEPLLSPGIYGGEEVSREFTAFTGEVRGGLSGGPVLDSSGRVLTTVLGSDEGSARPAGLGAANADVAAALELPAGPVSTGACPPPA